MSRGSTLLSSRRTWLLSCLGGISVIAGGTVFRVLSSHSSAPSSPPNGDRRLISLSPGITETLLSLGQGAHIVGISDYCDWPAVDVAVPQRVGSALTPDYEKMARLRPTLILASDVAGQQLDPLSALSPTESLPWLTVRQFSSSVLRLGRLVQEERKATALSDAILEGLPPEPPPRGPRVLLAFDNGGANSNETWFIRRNSIHGAVLHGAGARNAVDRDIFGQPKLSPEELIQTDPDAILVLRSREPDRNQERLAKQRLGRLGPLTAVRRNHVVVLSRPSALSVGPGVLSLISPIRESLRTMGLLPIANRP